MKGTIHGICKPTIEANNSNSPLLTYDFFVKDVGCVLWIHNIMFKLRRT